MEVIPAIDADDIRRYLRAHGWIETRSDEQKDIWSPSEEASVRLLLPKQRFEDYETILWDAVTRLSVEEGRPAEDVLVDLEWPEYDKLVARTRVDRASPAVPLEDGLMLAGALRDLVVASARASEKPQPSFRGGWSNVVGNYVDQVQTLPSRPGSYSLRALLPLNASAPEELLIPTAASASIRNVTRTLLSGVAAARQAAADRAAGAGDDVFEAAVEQGVSADLLDAIVRLGGPELDAAPVELSVTWTYAAPDTPVPPILVPAGLLPVLAHGADVLRGTPDDVEATVTGLVVRLHRQDRLGAGDITVHGFIDSPAGSANRQIRIELDEATYEEAIAAHKDGASVQVRCIARFGGTRIEVTRVLSFDVQQH